MGTMLQTHGLKPGELPESYNLLHPEIIERIHREYLAAGSDIITTNTFGANRYKLNQYGYNVEEIVSSAVQIARQAAKDKLVALDIGPSGQLMQPYGTLSFEDAYKAFAEQVIAGAKAGADLILIETMSDVYEAKAAILAAQENSDLPVIATMTFQSDGRTLTGTDPLTMVNIIQGLGVKALGVNCSLGPKEILPVIEEILAYSKVPVMAQPNAGLPKVVQGKTVFDVGPEAFAQYAKMMAQKGVTILGGCCGTNPSHIKAIKKELAGLEPVKREIKRVTAVSSFADTVIIGNGVTIIGERINPTGKKHLKEALRRADTDYILHEAIKQRDAGAHILDVNVGLPEIDEEAVMVDIIKEIQSIVSLPLQIDSARPDVIESAARIYNGKPLINSVSGKQKDMEQLFPIVKKYGAAAVCLTLDEDGIPAKAEERLKIAAKIVQTAEQYGIDKEDLIIDCLVLTASAQQSQVKETIKAVALVQEKLGVKTTLGVSNVSFGLPERGLLNRTFLAAALAAGLNAPILNPLDEDMAGTVQAFNVLWGHDKDAAYYIATYGGRNKELAPSFGPAEPAEMDLDKIIINGIREQAPSKTKELLQKLPPLAIVDQYLIPALDIVGRKYEQGEIFLPQLIQSAETVKKAFGVIKHHLVENQGASTDMVKGKILLATVRGDIHDIGKNIVKILLENYGFEVIDLGKDVPEEDIVRQVKENKIALVGLSALMTTTVRSMENTIRALKDEGLPCKVMVGGAVLNDDYAQMIGADYYGRDAREAVKIAQEFFA
ncbi:MAG: dihydropteroate synthase [Firmicutes bacterium]|nr:dihydropteroate synthase [Bacillota bacterium]